VAVWSASATALVKPRPQRLQQPNKLDSGFGLNRYEKAARFSALLFSLPHTQ
jgi:hypothetical protein